MQKVFLCITVVVGLLAGMLVAPLAASAAIGASSTTSAPLSTAGPDLRTAAVTSVANDRVRFCFDQPVANFGGSQGSFHLNGYNDDQFADGQSIADDPNPNCVLVEFSNSESAVTQYTVATVDPFAVSNATASNFNVEGASALTGISLGPGGIGGRTSTADLMSAAKNGPNGIDYTYDEVLDDEYVLDGCDDDRLGFWDSDGERVTTPLSCSVAPGSSTANATFADASDAVRFFSLQGAVRDRGGDTASGQMTNPLSSTTQTHTETADLTSASRVNDTTVDYTFDQGDPAGTPVDPTCDETKFYVYEEDGTEFFGSGDCVILANSASTLVIRVSGFSSTNFSAFETPSAAVEFEAVEHASFDNTDGARPLGTSREASGFTDAPDLESADFDSSFNRVTFNFDENVNPASATDPFDYCVVDNNDDVECSDGASPVSVSNNQVTWSFDSGDINTAVGALVRDSAANDYPSNDSVKAAVGRGPAPPAGTIQFSSSALSVNESAGACPGGGAQLTVTRTGGNAGAASVNFATANGSATQGSDYTNTSGTLNWADGDSSSRTVCVSILQDALPESSENFTVTLSGATGAALGAPSVATVTILDDDAGQGNLSFSSSTYITGEANNAVITVVRTGGSSGTVTVNFATSNGTAVAGSDYASNSGTLIFGNGVTSQNFTVPVINDSLDESDETVNLTLSSPGGGAGLVSPSTAVLTIVDNDTAAAGAISLSSATYTTSESAQTATITAIRTGGSQGAVTVQFAVTSGTATSGSDFTAVNGTLTFADGDVSEQFTVPITNDTLDEPDETANIALSSPTGGATLGSPSTATLTIVDDDAPPPPPECSDGIDNDEDGEIDFPADDGCENAQDDSEGTEGQETTRVPSSVSAPDHGSPFHGFVSSRRLRCERRRHVVIKKVRPGRDPIVARDRRTNRRGRYLAFHTRPRHGSGRFYALVKRRVIVINAAGDRLVCLRDRSRARFIL